MPDSADEQGRLEVAPGEQPLLAFVSSVMRDELKWARDETVRTLRGYPGVVTWAFEFTPPSSQSADAAYFQKVREADIVIWLLGEETTEPVRNEVAEALAAKRRIWAIRLPAATRSEETERLLAEVGRRAKWGDAADPDSLRETLTFTFRDEVVRALRERPGLTRLALLEQLAQASRERMVVRWRATGLSAGESVAFVEDLTVGAPAAELLPTPEEPLKIVVGDVGAGKSVVAERALQSAIAAAGQSVGARVPVFMRAREVGASLERAVLAAADGLGDPRLQGAFVVVDGLDEVPQAEAAQTLDAARVLVRTLPETRILLTSRPTAVTATDERVKVPLLDEKEALALARRVAGQAADQGLGIRWPRELDEEARRPLFVILFALDWRERESFGPTTGALLANLVERAIERDRLPAAAWPTLQKLAVLVTARAGAPVPVDELGDFSDRVALGDSRLVVEEDGRLGFSLPIFAQWFAAESLKAGTPTVEEIVAEPSGLDRWRYPLAIAVANGPAEFVDGLLDRLARHDPGFAAELLGESLSRWARDSGEAHEDWRRAGAELRSSLLAWGEGVAPLDGILLPHQVDGSVSPLAVRTGNGWLSMGWHDGAEAEGEVVLLPAGVDWMRQGRPGWMIRRSGKWHGEKGWAWNWGLELLRSDLASLVKSRALPVDDPGLLDEALWLMAPRPGGAGAYWPGEVPLDSIREELQSLGPNAAVELRDRVVDSDLLLAHIERLALDGVTSVGMPWPGPDRAIAGGWVWDPYSPERQLERARAVYAAAIHAYQALVDAWFGGLRARMYTAAVMPARLVGEYEPPVDGRGWDAPTMSWHWEPLPEGSNPEVAIELGTAPPREDWYAEMEATQGRLRQLRPEAAGWLSTTYTSQVVDVFDAAPVCEIAYKWLEADLKRINWFA